MPVRYRSLPFLFLRLCRSKLRNAPIQKCPGKTGDIHLISGEGGIRTLGTVARTTVFETATIDRSATSPEGTRGPGLGPAGRRRGKRAAQGETGRKNKVFGWKNGELSGILGKGINSLPNSREKCRRELF